MIWWPVIIRYRYIDIYYQYWNSYCLFFIRFWSNPNITIFYYIYVRFFNV